MKNTIILGLLLAFSTGLLAQNKHPHVVEIPNHGISIKGQRFNLVEVVDNRPVKGSIGTVKKGMSNMPTYAVLPGAMDVYLLNFLQQNVSTYTEVSDLILKIDHFQVSERTLAAKEIGYAEVGVEFLLEDKGTIYSLGKFESKREVTGIDVTGKHGENLFYALKDCINQFSESNNEPVAILLDISNFAILDFQPYMRKSTYQTFADWTNISHVSGDFQIKGQNMKGNFPRYQVKDSNTKKGIKGLYGFSDGESFYLNASHYSYGNYFVKSQLVGPLLLFEDQITDPMAGVAFGMIGALASMRTNTYLLDSRSGLVRMLDDLYMKELLHGHPELMEAWKVASGKKRENKKEIISQLNAKLIAELMAQP
ncbi:hypothetical protein [Arthrospiribacter ruber]|uniref:Uncharacterized protein n=1 Tax=Arthrospiribacter ruber TaxID=2487934 RepID=A0A951MAQ1_9BACT|nr:hypothetical protein [Arthrospiribacter ruber]MBW3466437.1 hypothetical protein [Arthrospiribacter ruber]